MFVVQFNHTGSIYRNNIKVMNNHSGFVPQWQRTSGAGLAELTPFNDAILLIG